MNFSRISYLFIALLLLNSSIHAEQWCSETPWDGDSLNQSYECQADEECCLFNWCGNFYIRYGSGVSYSQKADIHASDVFWDRSLQGYDASLKSAPIILGGIGTDIFCWLSTDSTFAYRPNYSYRKFQTPVDPETSNLGPHKREFDLDIATYMWTVYLNGRGIDYCSWNCGCLPGTIYPFLGGGIGISRLNIYNFRSTGIPLNPPGNLTPSFASENEYTVHYHFTYQLLFGFEYNFCDQWAVSLGYRWFDVGEFDGPRFIRDSHGRAFDVQSNPWKIKFAANEWFLDFKVYL